MMRATGYGILLASVFYVMSPGGVGSSGLGSSGLAWADSGPLRDPTGCASGSAVANCRSLPPQWRPKSDSDLRNKSNRRNAPLMPRTSPLPSEKIQRMPPPPSSTGLDKGSTGLKGGSGSPQKRIGH